MTEYDTIYLKLSAIFEKHRRKYKSNPKSKQLCCMWSSDRLPDILKGTPPLCDIEDAFEIDIDEDLAVEFYDMHLDEAAKKIMDLQRG
ncbi:MAG: hypothetical protein ACOYL3_12425 [Desulfuromonadaceae bacterium]